MHVHGGETFKYRPPMNVEMEPLEFSGRPTTIRSLVQYTSDGEVRQETKSWQVERLLLDAEGILHPQRNATIEDADGKWNVNVTECVWGDVFVTLAMIRAPRTAGNELRSAAI